MVHSSAFLPMQLVMYSWTNVVAKGVAKNAWMQLINRSHLQAVISARYGSTRASMCVCDVSSTYCPVLGIMVCFHGTADLFSRP